MSDWQEVAMVEDVPEGGTLRVDYGSAPVCLYNVGGQIYATDDNCSHGQASLADGFLIDDTQIECPLHQGTFDIRTGKAVSAPCKIDIKSYGVKLEGNKVFVKG
jgi:nitrite reductase/ring-hydroxylating ferredoxin subunit